jgi:hypothetical protein
MKNECSTIVDNDDDTDHASLFECTTLLKVHTLANDAQRVVAAAGGRRRSSHRLSTPSLTLEEFEFLDVEKSVIVEACAMSCVKMFSFLVL